MVWLLAWSWRMTTTPGRGSFPRLLASRVHMALAANWHSYQSIPVSLQMGTLDLVVSLCNTRRLQSMTRPAREQKQSERGQLQPYCRALSPPMGLQCPLLDMKYLLF